MGAGGTVAAEGLAHTSMRINLAEHLSLTFFVSPLLLQQASTLGVVLRLAAPPL